MPQTKPRGPVWQHFHEVDNGEYKHPQVACNHCNHNLTAQAPKMQKHLDTCMFSPPEAALGVQLHQQAQAAARAGAGPASAHLQDAGGQMGGGMGGGMNMGMAMNISPVMQGGMNLSSPLFTLERHLKAETARSNRLEKELASANAKISKLQKQLQLKENESKWLKEGLKIGNEMRRLAEETDDGFEIVVKRRRRQSDADDDDL